MSWVYDLKDIREDVQMYMKDSGKMYVAHVTSGDSGEKYWVQIFIPTLAKTKPMSICQCNQGFFQWAPAAYGFKLCCKHAENLLVYINERKKGNL